VKYPCRDDDLLTVVHLLNLLSVDFLIYAGVTRGALAVARILQRVVRT
jgi:hypothetical protein